MDVNHCDPHASTWHGVNDKTGDHGLPNDHVRLVRIWRRRIENLLLCDTFVFSLPTSPGYTAISYAWGPPVAEHAILLNGREHLVAKNLWHFLTTWRRLHFRDETAAGGPHPPEKCVEIRDEAPYSASQEQEDSLFAPDLHSYEEASSAQESPWKPCYSWLWIDALSIDQNNMQERNHQVKIMSRIFGGADEVLVWLGLASTRIDKTMSDLKSMHSSVRDLWVNGQATDALQLEKRVDAEYLASFALALPTSGSVSRSHFKFMNDTPLRNSWVNGQATNALQEICDRMYWTRLWVFQELRSAKHISLMCGGGVIPFAKLANSLTIRHDPASGEPEHEARSRGS
jgi:hypothetical protein